MTNTMNDIQPPYKLAFSPCESSGVAASESRATYANIGIRAHDPDEAFAIPVAGGGGPPGPRVTVSGLEDEVYKEPEERNDGVLMPWIDGSGRTVGCGINRISQLSLEDDDVDADDVDDEPDYDDGGGVVRSDCRLG